MNILVLDGGGIRGVFTAAVLNQIEESTQVKLVDIFDLVVGTSTGGIIALGLGANISPGAILEFYKVKGPDIFPPPKEGFFAWIMEWFEPKYNPTGLSNALKVTFGERKFFDSIVPLAITSFNADNGHPKVFKSGYHKEYNSYANATMVDIGMATSAAPTYFPASENSLGVSIDGGVWANCPVLVGIVEAMSMFRKKPTSINVLNIGTVTSPFMLPKELRKGGLLDYAKPIASLLMHANRVGNLEMAKKLGVNIIRMDKIVKPDEFKMDDIKAIQTLENIGREVAIQDMVTFTKNFVEKRKLKPLRKGGNK